MKPKVFKKDETKEVRLAQNLTMGEPEFNHSIRLRNQLVFAVRDFSKEEKRPTVQVKLLAKEIDVQLKLAHKVVEVVGRPQTKICVTLLRYNVKSQRVHILKFGCLEEERRKKNSIKWYM